MTCTIPSTSPSGPSQTLALRVQAGRLLTDDVVQLELRAVDGLSLPAFTAGAHIELTLPNGLRRHYSLLNDPRERHRYLVAVHRAAQSRGGSRYLHDGLRLGQCLPVSPPRNHFALDEKAPHSVLIGGGIGITPLLAMAHRLHLLGSGWQLHYAVRNRPLAAFGPAVDAWNRRSPGRASMHLDDEAGGVLDLRRIVQSAPTGSHFYCCGPGPMLAAFEQATAELEPGHVHVEYFQASVPAHAPETSGSFIAELARSGRTLTVPAGRSLLDILLDAGVDAPYSCGEGFCGSCRIGVLAGVPEHRDSVLSTTERAANGCVIACCSRSHTERLVLDL